MMGRQPAGSQKKMFYYGLNLEDRIRADHPLRKVAALIDFGFIYKEVESTYGYNGNVSAPPPVILKLMLLLVFYNVRSERELVATIPERLDWLWFLGMDIDESIPDRSVLSKARARWGPQVFKSFFERVVWQCVEAGLVDGSKIFMDSSLIDANASNNSVVNTKSLKRHLNKSYKKLEARLEDKDWQNVREELKEGAVNQKLISTTDPDASLVRQGPEKSRLRFKTHRAVDVEAEIITAVEVTTGAINEAHLLPTITEEHEKNTQRAVDTAVADSHYGTAENFLYCKDRGINAHFPKATQRDKDKRLNKTFPEHAFKYDPQSDTYLCPGGQILTRRTLEPVDGAHRYQCRRGACRKCRLNCQCTKSKTGRVIRRHHRHEELKMMLDKARSPAAKRDIKTRTHLMERSFARSVRFSFDRARWRGLAKVKIQEYLVAAIQNIQVLMGFRKTYRPAVAMAVEVGKGLSPKPNRKLTSPLPMICSLLKIFQRTMNNFFAFRPQSLVCQL